MVKSIILKNFKIYKNIKIEFDNMLSVLTGKNNSGKTSILEAFLIFQEAYNITLTKIERQNSNFVKNQVLTIGNFYFKEVFIIAFNSVRSKDYYELFHNENNSFSIEILFKDIKLEFVISKGRRGGSGYTIKPNISDTDLKKLNQNFNIQNFFYATKSSAIYSVNQYEPYYSSKMVEKLSLDGNKQAIFRNNLLRIRDKFLLEKLQNYIEGIFNYKKFEFDIDFDINRDLYIKIFFSINSEKKQDIALIGSGSLQIIEVLISILLVGDFNNKIILLDEPDSHLHRNIQKILLQRLRDYSNNGLQIILTTHNEQVIALSKLNEILHITNNSDVKSIQNSIFKGRQFGFSKDKSDIYRDLGISNNSMMFIEALESDRIILIEGRDRIYIEKLQKKREELFLHNNQKKVMFWSLNGVDNLEVKISRIKPIFEAIKNGKNLWSKIKLLIDKDHRTDLEVTKLFNKIKIDGITWNSYTIESIFLENIPYLQKYIFENYSFQDLSKFNLIFNETISKYQNIEQYDIKIEKQRKQHNLDNDISYIRNIENITNRLHLLANKTIFQEILDSIFDKSKKERVSLEIFLLDFISRLDSNSWNEKWNIVLQKIYGE